MENPHYESQPNLNSKNTGTKIINNIRNIDKLLVTTIFIFICIWLFIPKQLFPTVEFALINLWEILPYLLVSIFFAGYIKATGADELITRSLRRNSNAAIMIAAVVGAFAPFCSCGVVPLIAALLASGVPLAPVMAFLLSSPTIDPQMAILTAGVLGVEFAVAKILSAIWLGLMGGYAVILVQKMGGFNDFLKDDIINNGCSDVKSGDGKNENSHIEWKFWKVKSKIQSFIKESRASSMFLAKWLSFAFILEGLMIRNVPMNDIGDWLTSVGNWSIPAAALVGVPAYMNGYAGIPLADAMMKIGLSPPAALSFMVAGGVTCIPAAIAVKALVKLPVFFTYLIISALGSLSVGFIYAAWLAIS